MDTVVSYKIAITGPFTALSESGTSCNLNDFHHLCCILGRSKNWHTKSCFLTPYLRHLNVKNSKTAVASFNIQGDIESIDVTKTFSKKNPIFLSAVVKDGPLYLFKHVLNGKPKKDLEPQ
ncbi:hypothetical protein AVEN_112517-1, partial [Araneus ventricosus]